MNWMFRYPVNLNSQFGFHPTLKPSNALTGEFELRGTEKLIVIYFTSAFLLQSESKVLHLQLSDT